MSSIEVVIMNQFVSSGFFDVARLLLIHWGSEGQRRKFFVVAICNVCPLSCTFPRHVGVGDMSRDVVTLSPTFPVCRPKCRFEGFVSTYVETYQIGPLHHLFELFLPGM